MEARSFQRLSPTTIGLDGRELIAFAGCDYLGLSHHPELLEALSEGAARFGITTAAARQTTGNAAIYDELETAIAGFLGTESAILTLDGYTANLAAAQAMQDQVSIALLDARAHASLRDAAALANLTTHIYPHLDAGAAIELASRNDAGPVAVLTDGIFAADGARALLHDLMAGLPDDGLLLVDDCHGIGTIGERGSGSASHAGIQSADDRLVITGTFAKALGCHGGFIAAPEWFCSRVRRASSVYQTTTPPSPAIAAAALRAIAIVQRDTDRLARLRNNAVRMRRGLRSTGLSLIDTPAPIFAFTLHPAEMMTALHDALLEAGFLAPVLSYPHGPADRYFRLSVMSEHTLDQIDGFTSALRRLI